MPAFSASAATGRPASYAAVQPGDAGLGGEVGLDGGDIRAAGAQAGRGGLELVVLGGDDQVEVVRGELLGELEADAAGRAGHDGERALV